MKPHPFLGTFFAPAAERDRWARWGDRNNPDAEVKIARLLQAWRTSGRPIVHVRHESLEPNSTYRPGQPVAEFKPVVAPPPPMNGLSSSTQPTPSSEPPLSASFGVRARRRWCWWA